MSNFKFHRNSCAAWITLALGLAHFLNPAIAQYPGWQQAAVYDINVELNAINHQYSGIMTVTLTNNSPDPLNKAFFHTFFNAFQPGSMMDVRSRTIVDPDSRVGDRIANLAEDDWGWIRVESLAVNQKQVQFVDDGTILEVILNRPILPGKKAHFQMAWKAQVPKQIRRSGWMNHEGVEFSMTQWYPKLCEYDHDGWHTDPYVGREFHGIWSDYDVTIQAPIGYEIGGTGTLSSSRDEAKLSGKWHFQAENVIDFAWAADPDFIHTRTIVDGTELQFIYQKDSAYQEAWESLPQFAEKAMIFLENLVGPYPYPQYSIVQGGDGGMEYPMCTLVTGNRSLRSLVGVTVHEMAHSWFQALIATNESLYEYLDEGMASYVTTLCMEHLFKGGITAAHRSAYSSYINHALSGNEEPLTTHADHYQTNRAYGVAAYSKGEVLLAQLGYVMGHTARDAGLQSYFKNWSYKHPGPSELKREMEHACGFDLDWYFQYFVNTTHTIDYGIQSIESNDGTAEIVLERIGAMPMPIDLTITCTDGSVQMYHIPLVMMRGQRALEPGETLLPDWPWTNPTRTLNLPISSSISKIEIDANRGMADIDRSNNSVVFEPEVQQQFRAN